MAASLSFKLLDRQTDAANLADIKTIVYEDSAGNKYTFGVDNNSVFDTFKYDPNGAGREVDYSATAKNFMTGGAIAALLAIGTNVDAIQTKTDFIPDTFTADVAAIKDATSAANLGNKVTAIQTKTDFIPNTFTVDVAAIKTATNAANLGDKVTAIKAKTDKMPDDLKAELIELVAIGKAINGNGNVTQAAKAVLESSFKQAITDAGKDGSEWLKDTVQEIVSQPYFELPTSADAALHWTW